MITKLFLIIFVAYTKQISFEQIPSNFAQLEHSRAKLFWEQKEYLKDLDTWQEMGHDISSLLELNLRAISVWEDLSKCNDDDMERIKSSFKNLASNCGVKISQDLVELNKNLYQFLISNKFYSDLVTEHKYYYYKKYVLHPILVQFLVNFYSSIRSAHTFKRLTLELNLFSIMTFDLDKAHQDEKQRDADRKKLTEFLRYDYLRGGGIFDFEYRRKAKEIEELTKKYEKETDTHVRDVENRREQFERQLQTFRVHTAFYGNVLHLLLLITNDPTDLSSNMFGILNRHNIATLQGGSASIRETVGYSLVRSNISSKVQGRCLAVPVQRIDGPNFENTDIHELARVNRMYFLGGQQ